MRLDSSAQAPKSINLQRSEQNGLLGFFAVHFTDVLHVGHVTMRAGSDITSNTPGVVGRRRDVGGGGPGR